MSHKHINAQTGEETNSDTAPAQIQEQRDKYLEHAWEGLRVERNARLAECDWTVLGDSPTSTAAWKAYRQALRDLPANTNDPTAPDWPTPPS